MPDDSENHIVARSSAIQHLTAGMALLDSAGEDLASAFVAHALDSLEEGEADLEQVEGSADL